MVTNVIQIKIEIMINVYVSAKKIYVNNIIFGILVHVVANMVNIQQSIITSDKYSVITSDNIIDVEETKIIPTNFNEKNTAC